MGKWCLQASSFIFYWIIIRVTGNQDRHKSSDKFDFRLDQTTHFGVTCPWMIKILHFRPWMSLRPDGQSWSNFMCSITGGGKCFELVHFLIEWSSQLLVTRTGIKALLNSVLGWIRPFTLELLALEWRKFHTSELEYLWSQCANLDQILCIASLGWVKGCIRFWGRLDQNPSFHGKRKPPLTYNGENDVSTFSRLFFMWSF